MYFEIRENFHTYYLLHWAQNNNNILLPPCTVKQRTKLL